MAFLRKVTVYLNIKYIVVLCCVSLISINTNDNDNVTFIFVSNSESSTHYKNNFVMKKTILKVTRWKKRK